MSTTVNVILSPLEQNDREQFIKDNQRAFKFGATEEFGMRDDHFKEDGEIISRKTIEKSIDEKTAETYRIILDHKKIGGIVIKIDKDNKKGELVLFFVNPENHSKGVGYSAWMTIEKMHPEIEIWETMTPYFEKRNIHFYVNKCGFHIVEFYHKFHPDPHKYDEDDDENKDNAKDKDDDEDKGEMFRFQKIMKK